LIGRAGDRSQRISWDEVMAADPDILIAAPCGYAVDRAQVDLDRLRDHPIWARLRAVRAGRVHVFDGSAYFNRPGPRLVDSLELLAGAVRASATV
jgi:iron complex transport system substrate-binding protein